MRRGGSANFLSGRARKEETQPRNIELPKERVMQVKFARRRSASCSPDFSLWQYKMRPLLPCFVLEFDIGPSFTLGGKNVTPIFSVKGERYV